MGPRKFAIVEDGSVTNIISMYAKNLEEFPNAILIEGTRIGIGWGYIDGEFVAPAEQVLIEDEGVQL